MSDETTGIYQPGEAEGQPPPAPDNQPQFVTPDQLDARLAKFYQDVQKMTTKQENRVSKKLSEWEKRVIEAGISVTPEMKNTAQQRIAMDMLNDEAEAAQPDPYSTKAPTGNPITQKVVDETNAGMRALQKKYDYVLTENDPEYWEVPWTGSTPEVFLQTYEAKLKDAAPRRGRQLPSDAQPGNPAARVPGPSGASVVGEDAIREELVKLQSKSSRTGAEENRRKQLESELLKLIPRR